MYLWDQQLKLGLERQKMLLEEAEKHRLVKRMLAQGAEPLSYWRIVRNQVGRLFLLIGRVLVERFEEPEEQTDMRFKTS